MIDGISDLMLCRQQGFYKPNALSLPTDYAAPGVFPFCVKLFVLCVYAF